MDKVEIGFKERKWKTIPFDDKILVKPYISAHDQLILISIYLNELFANSNDPEYNHSRAESAMVAYILDKQTNIKLYNDEESEAIVDMDIIFENWNLYEQVEKAIINMADFKRRLFRAVEERKEQMRLEMSLPSTIRNVSNKILEFLDGLKDLDLSDEGLSKLKDTAKEISEMPIIKDAVDIFKNKKTE
jgi:hypothetical protein